MIKSLIIFSIGLLLWFTPELVMFTRRLSDYVYQEAANASNRRVEVKIVRAIPYLPDKFATLARGEKNMRVEMIDEVGRAVGSTTKDDGSAIFSNIDPGEYLLRVAKVREYGSADLRRHVEYGQTLILDNEKIETRPDKIVIAKDSYHVAIIPGEEGQ